MKVKAHVKKDIKDFRGEIQDDKKLLKSLAPKKKK